MDIDRPDPDRLLARLKAEEADAARGKLKIFFGASAGVGKTFAMLQAAHRARESGADVLVGVIETHGRAETQALIEGLEVLPQRAVAYRERTLQEFDLDEALARKPALLLVDELAHSNAPGSRHPKRWQDVEELRAAGIDVWTTMNVQHLESLNDVVSGITGIRVFETVPDHVFDVADEVVIVDLPPDELLQRLKDGKVYLAQQAERAVRNFFRKGNLIALRELALRRTADRVDREVLQYRQGLSAAPVWPTRESLLLCLGPDERADKLVRATARMAAQLGVPWHCVHVETPALERQPERDRLRTLRVLKLAQDAGATTASLSGRNLSAALVRYAHDHNLSRVVLGRDVDRRLPWWRRTLAEAIGQSGPDLDVIQVALPARGSNDPRAAAEPSRPRTAAQWKGYGWSTGICGAVALLTAPLHDVLDLANIVMIFLLAVVFVAVRFGRGPAVLAAFMSVAAFDFFYVPPRFTFTVGDAQYLLTFAVMLVVALVIGQLTAGLKFQARVASAREARVRALYELSRDLSSVLVAEQVDAVAARFARSHLGAHTALMIAGADDRLAAPPAAAGGADVSIAQWAYAHNEAAGLGTNTLPASAWLYLPLRAPMRTRGVLALRPDQSRQLAEPEQRQLLDTCASLLAISLERIHYVDVARSTTVQMESERLRNSLLSAISHDLRTPLASLVGLADTLRLTRPPPTLQQLEVADAMRGSALRMNALVNNLLDMARLEAGAVHLNRQWQPLEEVVGSSLAATGPSLGGRQVDVRLADGLPLLQLDAVLMERVLVNLLENAAKYTPEGTPIVVRAEVVDDRVELAVEDRGPGLPKGKEEAIFQKFERGRKESATPGVGLGLSICRAIVQAHGGSVRAENRADGGARFIVSLPRGEPPADSGADSARHAP